MSASGIWDDLGRVQVKPIVTSERSSGRGGRETMPVIWKVEIIKEYKFNVAHIARDVRLK